MEDAVVEVESGTVKTFDGEAIEVHGGAYLPPQAFLRATTELQRLRARVVEQDQVGSLVPIVACCAGLAGLALGFWLGRRDAED